MVQVGTVLGSMAKGAMTKRKWKSNLTEEIMADSAVVEYTKKIASTIEQKKLLDFTQVNNAIEARDDNVLIDYSRNIKNSPFSIICLLSFIGSLRLLL